jgi:hypothetical protein
LLGCKQDSRLELYHILLKSLSNGGEENCGSHC